MQELVVFIFLTGLPSVKISEDEFTCNCLFKAIRSIWRNLFDEKTYNTHLVIF